MEDRELINSTEDVEMKERETTQEAIVAVIESKLDQLIQAVAEIRHSMHDNSVDIADLKLKVNTYENKTEQQQKDIDAINKKWDDRTKWFMGILSGLILAVAGIIAHMVLGV